MQFSFFFFITFNAYFRAHVTPSCAGLVTQVAKLGAIDDLFVALGTENLIVRDKKPVRDREITRPPSHLGGFST